MSHGRHISRRATLLKNVAATAGAFAVPYLLPASALGLDGAAAPSNRIIYGYVGCGNHGAGWNFDQVYRCPEAQIIAVCDVDEDHLDAAKAKVDGHYGQQLGKDYKGCTAYGDFRELINRKDIDVVGIATPDHWHVIPAIMAAKAGKDVIGEKPLTLDRGGRPHPQRRHEADRPHFPDRLGKSLDQHLHPPDRIGSRRRGGQTQAYRGAAADRKHQPSRRRQGQESNSTACAGKAAEEPELRDVAGPGPLDALHPGPDPRQLPLEPGLLRRRDFRLGRPHGRSGPMGPRHRTHGPGVGRGQGRFPAAGRRPQHGRDVRGPLSSTPTA